MLSAVPYPRFRLYSQSSSYYSFVHDLILGKVQQGSNQKDLERAVCRKFSVPHAACVPQNRVGIYLAIKALIRPGQQVIMSPFTIADIVNMVILAGGQPLFADVERYTCNIDAKEVETLLNPRVGAVLITHLHGLAAEAHCIKEMCDSVGVPMIEDAAQGFGAREKGKPLGTIGTAGVYSFGMYKNVNAWLGGAVVSQDRLVTDFVRQQLSDREYSLKSMRKKFAKGFVTDLLTHPVVFKALTFWILRYGFLNDIEAINKRVRTELDTSRKNFLPEEYLTRLTPFQARLALSQFDQVDRDSETRIRYGLMYHDGLKDLEPLVIPPARNDFSHIYTNFPIQYENREVLIKWMMYHNRDVAAQHYKNTADLPWFSEYFRDCANARRVAEQLVFLPTYPRYPEAEVKKNIDVIRRFFKR
jgi:perosamine synthetase